MLHVNVDKIKASMFAERFLAFFDNIKTLDQDIAVTDRSIHGEQGLVVVSMSKVGILKMWGNSMTSGTQQLRPSAVHLKSHQEALCPSFSTKRRVNLAETKSHCATGRYR